MFMVIRLATNVALRSKTAPRTTDLHLCHVPISATSHFPSACHLRTASGRAAPALSAELPAVLLKNGEIAPVSLAGPIDADAAQVPHPLITPRGKSPKIRLSVTSPLVCNGFVPSNSCPANEIPKNSSICHIAAGLQWVRSVKRLAQRTKSQKTRQSVTPRHRSAMGSFRQTPAQRTEIPKNSPICHLAAGSQWVRSVKRSAQRTETPKDSPICHPRLRPAMGSFRQTLCAASGNPERLANLSPRRRLAVGSFRQTLCPRTEIPKNSPTCHLAAGPQWVRSVKRSAPRTEIRKNPETCHLIAWTATRVPLCWPKPDSTTTTRPRTGQSPEGRLNEVGATGATIWVETPPRSGSFGEICPFHRWS